MDCRKFKKNALYLEKGKNYTFKSKAKSIQESKDTTRKKFTLWYKDKQVFQCKLGLHKCQKKDCVKMNDYPFEYCVEHLKEELQLTVKPTTLNNFEMNGLFAHCSCNNSSHKTCIVFKKNNIICQYNGIVLNENDSHMLNQLDTKQIQLNQKNAYLSRPYIAQKQDKQYIDSSCLRGIGAFANHKPKLTDTQYSKGSSITPKNANAELLCPRTDNTLWLKALKDIKHDQEIFVDYGYDPIKEYKDFSHNTIPVE